MSSLSIARFPDTHSSNTVISSLKVSNELLIMHTGQKFKKTGVYQIRVKPSVKIDLSDFCQSVLNLLKTFIDSQSIEFKKQAIHSGKYPSWQLNYNNMLYEIVIAKGSNKGETFEKELLKEIQNHLYHGVETSLSKNAFLALSSILNIADIKSIEGRTGSTRRNFKTKKEDVGRIIADYIIELQDGTKKFISIKNVNGKTLANFGIANAFNDDFSANKKSTEWQTWLEPFSLNADHIKEGLEVYSQKDSNSNDVSFESVQIINKQVKKNSKIAELIRTFYGTGYTYLREQNNSSFECAEISDQYLNEKVLNNLRIKEIRYPCRLRKYISIELENDFKKYSIQIRTSKADILKPTEIKFVISGDVKPCKNQ